MVYSRDTSKNLLSMIEASVDNVLFRHLYVTSEEEGGLDVLQDGTLSCAYFVSSLLTLAGRMDRPHATVGTTIKVFDELSSWRKTEDPVPGDVVYWAPGADGHAHLGFFMEHDRVISNSARLGVPVWHKLRMDDGREPIEYWHFEGEQAA